VVLVVALVPVVFMVELPVFVLLVLVRRLPTLLIIAPVFTPIGKNGLTRPTSGVDKG
jgi:hypothetical protein